MAARKTSERPRKGAVGNGLTGVMEQLVNGIIRPLGLIVLTRERIQETLDEAAERGRLTRSDANDLVIELMRRGRQQTDELLNDVDGLLGRGRRQLNTATKRARRSESVDRLVQRADRARRTVGVGNPFPISGYDGLTAAQVRRRIAELNATELRVIRDYERRHDNRKSVVAAIEKALASASR